MLHIRGLRKSYGPSEVLRGIDLDVAGGEVVGLLGPNGAGKTTLVSVVAGLRPADGGTVRVGDVDALADPRSARQILGVAPQDLGVYPVLTARQNLRLFGELAGVRGRHLAERIDAVAEALSLTPFLDRQASTLSGGQKRRLHTAMALVHGPRLLFLDEPTVGADVRTRREVLDAVRALVADGSTVVYCTHYLPEIEQLDATVAVLEAGRIVARGTIDELVRAHTSPGIQVRFRDGTTRLYPAADPSAELPALLTALGSDVERIAGIDVIRPSLERAYLAITGHSATSPGPSTGDTTASHTRHATKEAVHVHA